MAQVPDVVFQAIVERTGAPFVVIDLTGGIVFASETTRALLGWAPDELVGRNITDFVGPDDVELAITAVAEIDSIDRAGAGVPLTLPVLMPHGGARHVEVAALPLYDLGIEGLIALRLRSAEAEHHLAEFVRSLVSGRALDAVLVDLSKSVAASTEAVGVAVHWGFDGKSFVGAPGSWPAAADIALDSPPLVAAMATDELTQVDAATVAGAPSGASTVWLLPVRPRRGPRPALVSIWRAPPDPPFLGHRRAFVRAVDYVELALVRAAEHERLMYLAGHDSLTGAANRGSFRESLAAALARGETNIAVGYCDLDRFKDVNDQFGHSVGDEVLVEVTRRIRAQLRGGDEVARIGGDEFTVLWRNIASPEIALSVAQRIVDAVDVELVIADTKVNVGVSIGLVLAGADADADSLLRRADAALYDAKRSGTHITLLH